MGWTELLKREGADFLTWLSTNEVLRTSFDELAHALWKLLSDAIRTREDAAKVWEATPAVLRRCNEQETYELPGAPLAYAWLHLLDRYARTWSALEKLTETACLPLAVHGVRTLDVGSGPGPSAFAIHDFYAAMTAFAELTGNAGWRQPPHVTCVEFDRGTNHLRHLLAEFVSAERGSNGTRILSIAHALHDFSAILPTEERKNMERVLRSTEDRYFDEVSKEWVERSRYSAEEANAIAQSLHRYRFIVCTNFLTTVGSVRIFERNLMDILTDAQAGAVFMLIGGKQAPYPAVYEYVQRLADEAGFRRKVAELQVSSEDTVVADRVYEEGRKVFNHLVALGGDGGTDKAVERVRRYFSDGRHPAPSSQVWAFRKY